MEMGSRVRAGGKPPFRKYKSDLLGYVRLGFLVFYFNMFF
jgi:hypothetical protein